MKFDIVEYKDDDYNDFKDFYLQILFESHHFTPYDPKTLKEKLVEEDRYSFIIRENDKIIAHVSIARMGDLKNALTFGFAVLKDYQRMGIGKKMMEFVFEFTKKLGYKHIIGTIHKNNYKSIIFNTKYGFNVIDDSDESVIRVEKTFV
jgi:GNAT superfamily N-acetyltransferase